MGLGQSSQEKKNVPPISSRFSTTELKKLDEFFKPNAESVQEEDARSDGWNYKNLKRRVAATFSEAIAAKMLNYMHMELIAKEKEVVSEQFLQLVYRLTKDSIKDLAFTVFHIVGGDEIVTRTSMKEFLSGFVSCLLKGYESTDPHFATDQESSDSLAEKLVEHCADRMKEEDFDVALHRTPLLIDVLQHKFRLLFYEHIIEGSKEVQAALPSLIPILDIQSKSTVNLENFLLSLPTAIYLNSKIPVSLQRKWRLLYSSKVHGESFSKMTGDMVGKGPTLLVVKDTHGHLFGGFASASWQYSSQFQGTNASFLFTAKPSLKVYEAGSSNYNNHFMYLNVGQETMPNGLGMGGQHDFFGLWLDQEFGKGHSRAKPTCTTYGSPQLSKNEEFKVEGITVWGVGDEPKKAGDDDEYDEDMTSVLDKHIEAKALLEIAGKPRVSEGLRDIEPDSDIPETRELQHSHDPMS